MINIKTRKDSTKIFIEPALLNRKLESRFYDDFGVDFFTQYNDWKRS